MLLLRAALEHVLVHGIRVNASQLAAFNSALQGGRGRLGLKLALIRGFTDRQKLVRRHGCDGG